MHCVYGNDRTGVAAFMTLVALGVDEKTEYKEYALTNTYLKKYGGRTYAKGGIGIRRLSPEQVFDRLSDLALLFTSRTGPRSSA